jgi:hypothetical protein
LDIGAHMVIDARTCDYRLFAGDGWIGTARHALRWSYVAQGAAIYSMADASDPDKEKPPPTRLRLRLVLGRPKWTNIALIVSLILFWAGLILKLLS